MNRKILVIRRGYSPISNTYTHKSINEHTTNINPYINTYNYTCTELTYKPAYNNLYKTNLPSDIYTRISNIHSF